MMLPRVVAFILAGGEGRRLFPLTAERSKPSVPFGGRFRIIDFVLSNVVNSGFYSIYILVQYKSQSLIQHIQENWNQVSVSGNQFITAVPPQMLKGNDWFLGTADAVFQNINLLKGHNPTHVVIFGSDHIYRMDISQMLDFHIQNNAKVTVAARPVPISEASAFGVIKTKADGRIERFDEKPTNPSPMPNDPTQAYASMGNYIFNTETLFEALADSQKKGEYDFGGYILPSLVDKVPLYAYDFSLNKIPDIKPYEEKGYWRDVGTIDAYWKAHLDLLGQEPLFDLHNYKWPIHPSISRLPAAKINGGTIINSTITDGVIINYATIKNSIIRSGVIIEEGVEINDCIILDDCHLMPDCKLNHVIIDKNNTIKEGARLGFDSVNDRYKLHIDECGIGIMPKHKLKFL
jgi:glucose-1-phosphate adenylyltransferase